MNSVVDILFMLRFLGRMKDRGAIAECFIKPVSNKDLDVYVIAPEGKIPLVTVIDLESRLYLEEETGITAIKRVNDTIKVLVSDEYTFYLKVKPFEDLGNFQTQGESSGIEVNNQ